MNPFISLAINRHAALIDALEIAEKLPNKEFTAEIEGGIDALQDLISRMFTEQHRLKLERRRRRRREEAKKEPR